GLRGGIVEEDDVHGLPTQALPRSFEGPTEELRVEALAGRGGVAIRAELGHDMGVLVAFEALAELLLHAARRVGVGGLEQGDSHRASSIDHAVRFALGDGAVAVTGEAPGAERELGDLEFRPSESSSPHGRALYHTRSSGRRDPAKRR